VELDDHIQFVIAALQSSADVLGLSGLAQDPVGKSP